MCVRIHVSMPACVCVCVWRLVFVFHIVTGSFMVLIWCVMQKGVKQTTHTVFILVFKEMILIISFIQFIFKYHIVYTSWLVSETNNRF